MTAKERAAISALRAAYREAASPRGPACHSDTCLLLATVRVHWPVLAGEEYPLYCDACARRASAVLDALGLRVQCERLEAREPVAALRAISLDGGMR